MSRSSGHARQKMGRVYAAPKPLMHRPFSYKKNLDISLKKTFARFCDRHKHRCTGQLQEDLDKRWLGLSLRVYFIIFCIKLEGIKGYKLLHTPFFRKIPIFSKMGKKGPKWPKNRVFGLLHNIESLVVARNDLK